MGLFDGYPSIQVGAADGNTGGVNLNGNVWAGSPQVNGYPMAAGGAVVVAQVGRKQLVIATGGLYPAQTTHP